MERYGSDKPDTRFGMEIHDITGALGNSDFMVFKNTIKADGTIRAICVPGCSSLSRQELDMLTERARNLGAKGLLHIAYLPGGDIKSPVKKHLAQDEVAAIRAITGAKEGDLVLAVADKFNVAVSVLGRLRLEFGAKAGHDPRRQV